MRILIDIGHPAHVHYFRHAIKILQKNGHIVIVVSREKEITYDLLKGYGIKFYKRGKGSNSLLGKFAYLFKGSYRILKIARKHKIDLFVSFASPYNAIASVFYRKPNVAFDDTEHNAYNHRIYMPLSQVVLTPASFKKTWGKKHIRFSGTMDSAYLHPKYFKDREVYFDSNSDKETKNKNVILRFVSWKASHDINQKGFTRNDIEHLVEVLNEFSNIYISSESELPCKLKKHVMKIKPSDIHFYMKKADLFIGESGSMATESAYLGTHSIVLNSAAKEFGVFEWFSKFKTFYIASDFQDVLSTAVSCLINNDLKDESVKEAKSIVDNSLCLTDFMVWFIENYPNSAKVMRENPDYQYKFK